MAKKDGKLRGELFWTDRWMGSRGWLLSLEPRGLYREMLTQAWKAGGQLPNEPGAIRALCNVSQDEWDRCWPVVKLFWDEADDGSAIFNSTQREVIADSKLRSQANSDRAARASKARWNAPRNAPSIPPSNAPRNPSSITQASPQALLKHSPLSLSLSLSQSLSKDTEPSAPMGELVSAFEEILPELEKAHRYQRGPKIGQIKPEAAKDCRSALNRSGNLDGWREYFRSVRDYPCLMGQSDLNWKASLCWLLGPKNRKKVVTGQYPKRPASNAGRPDGSAARVQKDVDAALALHFGRQNHA